MAKPKDYDEHGHVDALHEYDAWRILRERGEPLQVGDLLEGADGQLRICKYVGFEPAQWVVPEPKQPVGQPVDQPGEPPAQSVEPPAATT